MGNMAFGVRTAISGRPHCRGFEHLTARGGGKAAGRKGGKASSKS
jgi:hypothetical protein